MADDENLKEDFDEFMMGEGSDRSDDGYEENSTLRYELEQALDDVLDENNSLQESLGFLSQAKEIVLFRDQSPDKILLRQKIPAFLNLLSLEENETNHKLKISTLHFFDEAVQVTRIILPDILPALLKVLKKNMEFSKSDDAFERKLIILLNNLIVPTFKVASDPLLYMKSSNESVSSDVSMNSLNLDFDMSNQVGGGSLDSGFLNQETVDKLLENLMEFKQLVTVDPADINVLNIRTLETFALICSHLDPKVATSSITGRKDNMRKETGPNAMSLTLLRKSVDHKRTKFLVDRIGDLEKIAVNIVSTFFTLTAKCPTAHVKFQICRSLGTLFQHRRNLRDQIMTGLEEIMSKSGAESAFTNRLAKTVFRSCFLPLLKADFLKAYHDRLMALFRQNSVLGDDKYLSKTVKELTKLRNSKGKVDKNRFDLVLKQSKKFSADDTEKEEVEEKENKIVHLFTILAENQKEEICDLMLEETLASFIQLGDDIERKNQQNLKKRSNRTIFTKISPRMETVSVLLSRFIITSRCSPEFKERMWDIIHAKLSSYSGFLVIYFSSLFQAADITRYKSELTTQTTRFEEYINVTPSTSPPIPDDDPEKEPEKKLYPTAIELEHILYFLSTVQAPEPSILQLAYNCILAPENEPRKISILDNISVFGFRLLERLVTTNFNLQADALNILLHFAFHQSKSLRSHAHRVILNVVFSTGVRKKLKSGEFANMFVPRAHVLTSAQDAVAQVCLNEFARYLVPSYQPVGLELDNVAANTSKYVVEKPEPIVTEETEGEEQVKEVAIEETQEMVFAKVTALFFALVGVKPELIATLFKLFKQTDDDAKRNTILNGPYLPKLVLNLLRSLGVFAVISLINPEDTLHVSSSEETRRHYTLLVRFIHLITEYSTIETQKKAYHIQNLISKLNVQTQDHGEDSFVELFLGVIGWHSKRAILRGFRAVLTNQILDDEQKTMCYSVLFKAVLKTAQYRKRIKESEGESKHEEYPFLVPELLYEISISFNHQKPVVSEPEMSEAKDDMVPEVKPEQPATSPETITKASAVYANQVQQLRAAINRFFALQVTAGVKIFSKDSMLEFLTGFFRFSQDTNKSNIPVTSFYILSETLKLYPNLKSHVAGMLEVLPLEAIFEGKLIRNALIENELWVDFLQCCCQIQTPSFKLLMRMPKEKLILIQEVDTNLFKNLKHFYNNSPEIRKQKPSLFEIFK